MSIRVLSAFAVLLVFATALTAQGRRKALIVGNADYGDSDSLAPTTTNDANAMYDALLAVGFNRGDIKRVFNRDHDELVTDIASFAENLEPGDKALFYFSGHGFSIGAEDYIVPIRFHIGATQAQTAGFAVSLTSILNRLLASNTRVIILDACRDEPDLIKSLPKVIGGGAIAKNLIDPKTEGTLIAFAAASGKQADATPVGGESIFTHYLVMSLGEGYGDLQDALDKTRDSVAQASKGQQHPGVYNDMQGDFPLGVAHPAAVSADTLDSESLTKAVRRNISQNTINRKLVYKFRIWKVWLALPANIQAQVEKVTYTFPKGYLKPDKSRYGDLNKSLGLTEWYANSCGSGSTAVDVELQNHNHITTSVDLCRVPESSDIPAQTR